MKRANDTTFSWVELDGNEVDCRVEFTYYPGDPGRLSGPPEDCYPPEPPEFEICRVLVDGNDVIELLDEAALDALALRIEDGYETEPDFRI